MQDGIDSSHWLPRGSSVINAYRANKGDLDITISDNRISHATPKDHSLLGWLIERNILEDTHRTYAMIFVDMQLCFRRPVGYKANSIYAFEFFGGNNPKDLDTLYLRVCRQIMGTTEYYINHALQTRLTDKNKLTAWANRGHYQHAFDKLAATIECVLKDYRDAQEKNTCANY